jgi:electron transport complex protein RnfG
MSAHETTGVTAAEAPLSTNGAGPVPAAADVKSSRLLAVLGTSGAIAGALLVLVYGLTLPAIEANRARVIDLAVKEVLRAPDRYDTLYVVNGALTRTAPQGVDASKLQQVYLGYRQDGERAGFAIVVGEPGFQDVVTLIFGYDTRKRALLGMKVLESKETPGLGDKIEKDPAFVSQFEGVQPPLAGVKRGKRTKPSEVDMITGATISSRTVIRIINNAVLRMGPLLDAYQEDKKG